jgi:hypothetical protein
MDATTILAVISCAAVFAGWLVLPHSSRVSSPAAVAQAERSERRATVPAA